MIASCFILVGLLFTAASPFPTPTDVRNFIFPEPGICGVSLVDRIRGGEISALNAHPWTVLIGVRAPGAPHEIKFSCGGSLISDQFVLTAAHCFGKFKPVEPTVVVRLGEWDIESEVDCDGNICSDKPIDFDIEIYRQHESYDPVQTLYDIALMKLPHSVSFTEFISPICLPLSEDLQEQPKIGRIFTVIGWGDTEKGRDEPGSYGSRYKKQTNIPVTDSKWCSKRRSITPMEFCAENSTDSQSCRGDSGGPVVAVENDGYWYQYGIVSFGSACGEEYAYGIFVRVSSFLPWIMKTMRELVDTSTSSSTDVE